MDDKPEESQDEQQQDVLKPERILIEIDGKDEWVKAYTLGNVAAFLGMTYQGLVKNIRQRKDKGYPITLWKPQIGRGTYILDEDLKNLMRAVPVDE